MYSDNDKQAVKRLVVKLIDYQSQWCTAPTLLCHIFINNYERFVGVIKAAGFLSDRKNAQVSTLTNGYKIKIVPKGFMSDTSPSSWVGTRLKAEALVFPFLHR